MMPVYTLFITAADGAHYKTLSDFPDPATAVADTGKFVSPEHPSVSIASDIGDDVQFLGAWDWVDGEAQWTPDG